MFRFSVVVVVLATLAAVGCVSHDGGKAACALDVDATYTVYTHSLSPEETAPQSTLRALLGECTQAREWVASCDGDVATFRCGTDTAMFRVLDADSDGFVVELEHGETTSKLRLAESEDPWR